MSKLELPKGWTLNKISELTDSYSGGTPSTTKNEYWNGGKIPWIRSGEIKDNILKQSKLFITKKGLENSSARLYPSNTVLVAITGATTGKTAFLLKESSGTQNVFGILPCKKILAKYMWYYMRFYYNKLISKTIGTAQRHVNGTIIKNTPIVFPSLNEQKKIVEKIEELFSISTRCRELLNKNLIRIITLKNSILQHAFIGKLVPQNLDDPPLNIIPKLQKKNTGRKASTDVKIGKLVLSVGKPNKIPPKGWEWVPLLQVSELATGHTPKRKNLEYWNGKIPWVTGGDASKNDGNYIFKTEEMITLLGVKNSAAVVLPKDTVCLAREASIGHCVLLGKPMATNQRFVNFICGDSLIPKYLMYLFLFERNYMFRFKEGSIFGTIYFPAVKAFHVCLPPINEQKRIVKKIDFMWSLIKKIEQEIILRIDTLNSFEKSVLRSAFEGNLVSQDPNDVPASLLLQKIKQEKEKLKQKEK